MEPLLWSWKFLRSSERLKAWLEQQHYHLKSFEARDNELKEAIKKLENERDGVQNKVVEETERYGRGIPDEVKGWINEVNEIFSEYRMFYGDKRRRTLARCLHGYLPKHGVRYRLSREAFDLKEKINKLLERAKFDTFSYWLGPPSMTAIFHNVGYVPFTSRDEIMDKINAALGNPSVRMIGLHGWSGVGKTTLVKEIAREAFKASQAKAKMFDVAVMANVTRNPDIRKIQGQIADKLGMKLEEESDNARAARIRERLKNEKESTLIILDDLWAALDFNLLGIPLESDAHDDGERSNMETTPGVDEHSSAKTRKKIPSENVKGKAITMKKNPSENDEGKGKTRGEQIMTINTKESEKIPSTSSYKGCKVLLISESKQVLLSQMEGKENSIYSLGVLKEKEAETLFKKKAGISDSENFEFEKLATQIASKCNGLPTTIITTARALKNQSRSVWEDVHQRLENKTLIAASEFSTKLSYELLENEELKDTFLLCARLGQDALIMDLVKYCIGLGFLEGIYTVREARSRVYALVGSLKVSGLLSYSYPSDHFTMSDIVRSAALSIASKEKHVFTMIKGKVDEWPDKEKLERYTAISLHHCDIIKGFPMSLRCPRLRVLHINNKDPHLEIPNNFFRGMKELRVLILTGINLSPFPLSIRCLMKLRMLCLEQCKLGEELSIIGALKNVRILSLSGSDIEKLPVELKHLTMLQILDISNCFKLREIPPKVISSLTSLEELYMRNTIIPWKLEEQTNQNENASLSELRHLNQLTTLDIQIREVSYLRNNLFFDKLSNYSIVVGDLGEYLEIDFKMPEKYEESRFLAIQSNKGFDIHSQKGIKMLFETVENLFLEELEDVQDLFYGLNLKGFPCLKHLLIVNNSKIQSLIKPEERRDRENRQDRKNQENTFHKLESLYLCNLKVMYNICSCNLSAPSFGELRVIKINLCGQLKKVFSFSVARLLTVLETIEVSECKSLTEIVSMEEEEQSGTNEAKHLFPELRSLTLQSLSEFIGLYPISSTGEATILFDGKVLVSKLERMVLSSIQIGEIWSKSLETGFKSLIHLDVNDCGNLEYLISFSMAKCLVNLQSLFVSECVRMSHIFSQGEKGNNPEGNIFPKLKNIKLSRMKSLSEIWNSKFTSDSFGKLDTVIIEECGKLVNVFRCDKKGIFQSLCNLRVTNCRSMTEVFDLGDKTPNDGDVINLQHVHLETLPKLKHILKWNEDQDGMLKLNNLQKVLVHDCDNLENIFPVSVARCLHNLEYLVVSDCVGLREIVAKGEGATSSPDPTTFEFPKLTTVKISELPELESFYRGAHELKCPELKDLSIENCARLEPFRKEIFTEEVINKLKTMRIESWHAKSSSSYMGEWNPRRGNLEELSLSGLMSTELLYSFLHTHPNLKTLSLHNSSLTEIVPLKMPPVIEKYGVVPKLKSLKLGNLTNLETIGFERDMVLQRIEFLILKNCPCLVDIIPSSVCLTHLTNLEVVNCNGLEKLMSPSAAKSLGQLNTMKVIKCESLEEIVGNEDENNGEVDIAFRQLKTLELVSLKNLNSFCSSKSCAFEFPSLEKLVVSACPKMENFSEGVKSTPSLQKIHVLAHEQGTRSRCWKGNLKATIEEIFKEKKFFEGMDEINVYEHPELQAWHDKVGLLNRWFYSLKTLKLYKCTTHQYAIPSNILPNLKSLNELEVRNCNLVKVIFDMNGTENMETSQLKNLTLEGLLELKHVWDKNHQGILTFQNLQQLSVGDCKNLQSLIPAALAKKLKKLEKLEIISCHELPEIVGKKERAVLNMTEDQFVFPCLTSLYLFDLKRLTCFYPETFTLEVPLLNNLFVLDCHKLELFQSAHLEAESEGNRQPLFSDIEVISNVEKLVLDWKHISGLRSKQLTNDLKHLDEFRMFFDVDKNEKPTLPWEILKKASNLREMTIEYCKSLEMFHTQDTNISEQQMLANLKVLVLYNVSKLQSIWSEDSWLNTICDELHELHVNNCPGLTKFLHSTSAVSFSYLKELYIFNCHGLRYLLTSKAAEKFIHLEKIDVKQCNSIKEIVAKEQNQTDPQEIKFERLFFIDLNSLWSLECFYSGNVTLQLPSLIQVDIWQCPEMETFSQGLIKAESFRGIQASSDSNDELTFHVNLNSSVQRVFMQQKFPDDLNEMSFSEHPEPQEAWQVGVQNNWFYSLKTLKLYQCRTRPSAIPSNILPYLKSLNELEVQKCNHIEVIFDMSDTEIMESSSQLKKLTLDGLPHLKHVWKKNPQGILRFQNLQQVFVDECESLKTLFPAALAKNLKKLEQLEIKSCRQVLGIVEKEEGAAADRTEKFVFPSLTSLHLYYLLELTYFYPEIFTMECPKLNDLYVVDCLKLELFQSAHPEGEGEGRQPFFSDIKAVFNLERLEIDWKHISGLRSRQLINDFKHLNVFCMYFDVDENEKPTLPSEILEKAPNLREMTIGYCNTLEIFRTENPKVSERKMLAHLKKLKLRKVSELQSIGSEGSSWFKTVCENLNQLYVLSCPDMTTLVHSSAVSFSYLKHLYIYKCQEMKCLFTTSAARGLMHLAKIQVEQCDQMKEILAKDQDETTSRGIEFEWLYWIDLTSLSSLECFYSGHDTLRLPSLTQVDISQCPKMKFFSRGSIEAEFFKGIQASSDSKDDLFFYNDINASVETVFLLNQDHLVLGDSPMLRETWLTSKTVPDWCFCNLNSLVVEDCEFLSDVILPSHLLPSLKNLKKLKVKKCNFVKAIFCHAKMISTEGCLCLPSLEELHVENCQELVEIVAKDEAAIEEANKELIIFPSLSSLKLWNLPRLRCIYPGMRILEWPMLKVLNVIHCQMLKIFATEFQNSPVSYSEGEDSFPTDQQSFVSLEKVTPRLEVLPLGKEEAKMIEEGKLHIVGLQELHTLTLQCFHDKSDVFPFVFRSKAPLPNPKFLVVRHSDFQEIFPSQPPERTIILSQLQGLELRNLPFLKSIGLQYPWMDPFLKNLKFLYVFNCDRLTNLTVPSTTLSFSNLLKLHVTDCHALKHLFTSSTAKTFCVLKEVLVTNCGIEEIMATEEGDKPEELEFKQLETLTLCLLQKLESFYSGSFTLNFSSLKRVSFTKCRNKKIFRLVDILPNELEVQIDGVHSKGCQQVQQIIPMSTSLPNELVWGQIPMT